MAVTTTEKLTVTVPVDLAAAAKSAAGGNLSAWTTTAIREALVREAARMYAEDVTAAGADDDADDWRASSENDVFGSRG